jgi:hypothetical protein
MMPFRFRPVIAAVAVVTTAVAVVLAGCAAASTQSSATVAAMSRSVPQAGYPDAFVASASGSAGTRPGLAVFSASDGHLLHWLVRSTSQPMLVAVGPGGTWVYYYYPAAPRPSCPAAGFTEPQLWRVRAAGGRPQRTDIKTTNLAFSPDGKMMAYTAERKCGQTLLIVVRNLRTGSTRRIVAARNDLSGNGVISAAELSWAPDDVHLAVATAAAAAINSLVVVNARTATGITRTRPITPCTSSAAGTQVGCLNPGFDVHGRLTFLNWLETAAKSGEWVVRWQHRHAVRLFRLSRATAFSAGIAVDRSGNAILLEGYGRADIWRWSNGSLKLIRRSSHRLVVTSPLWL